MCFVKQVKNNNKEVGWQQKEASYTEACSEKGEGVQLVAHCAQLGRGFPWSPAFKD